MLLIRNAKEKELGEVLSFYEDLIDGLQNSQSKPGWKKGIYPAEDYLKEAIEKQELYVGILNGSFAGAMIINHECTDGYEKAIWKGNAKPEEVTVIHTLGVSPKHQRKGLATELVKDAIRRADENKQKAVRLDVLQSNISAQKLYESAGFECCGTAKMFYEDTGWTDFFLYEIVL